MAQIQPHRTILYLPIPCQKISQQNRFRQILQKHRCLIRELNTVVLLLTMVIYLFYI